MPEAPAKPNQQITLPELCKTHLSLFVHQARLKDSDPWRAFVIGAQIALFQAATSDPKTHERVGGLVERLSELGCLACYKPDAFGEIVEAAKTHDLGLVKALGEKWVKENAER